MSAVLAAVRPGDWNLPLFVHVAGAMLLVGAIAVVALLMANAVRRGDGGAAALTRLGFRGLLLGVLPSYVVMRIGAEWVLATEEVSAEAAWIGVGYGTSELGFLLLVVATLLAWRAAKKGDAGPGGAGRAAVVLMALVLVLYVVAIWAMTVKPA